MGYSLDLLKQIAHGLAQQFSDSCEIVIPRCTPWIENTILYIENGHVTDRNPVTVHPCRTGSDQADPYHTAGSVRLSDKNK